MIINKSENIALTFIILIVILYNIIIANAESITYAVYIDPGYGFYKVRDITTHNANFLYDNRTLDINQGDTVEWINDADNISLTIVSKDNLFAPVNIKIGKSTSYQFDQPGVFGFSIKEYPGKGQTIIVNSVGGNISDINSVETITSVPTETEIQTSTPSETETSIPVASITPVITESTPSNDTNDNISGIENLKLSKSTIPSIIVSVISIFIIFKLGKKG